MEYPKSIQNLAPKYQSAIDKLSDERQNSDGWWIYLKAPYWNPDMECRIIHEQSLTEAISILKGVVKNNQTKP